MPTLTVQPEGFVIQGPSGATIMEAARALGFYWPTTCDAQGICTSCAAQVLKGWENLSPMGRSERRTLERGAGRHRRAAGPLASGLPGAPPGGRCRGGKRGVLRPPEDGDNGL